MTGFYGMRRLIRELIDAPHPRLRGPYSECRCETCPSCKQRARSAARYERSRLLLLGRPLPPPRAERVLSQTPGAIAQRTYRRTRAERKASLELYAAVFEGSFARPVPRPAHGPVT